MNECAAPWYAVEHQANYGSTGTSETNSSWLGMTITNLALAIESVFGLTMSDVLGRGKSTNVNYARRVYVYLLMNELRLSEEGIAAMINRNRTTVYWYKNNMDGWAMYDRRFSELLISVKNEAVTADVFGYVKNIL